jgi:carboxyl-terminal processing protease
VTGRSFRDTIALVRGRALLLSVAIVAGAALSHTIAATAAPGPGRGGGPLRETLATVGQHYVDPDRVDPRAMLVAALDEIQRKIAEVMIRTHEGGEAVTVQVSDRSRDFSLADVSTLDALASRAGEILAFVRESVRPGTDTAAIEYAAVNGMLSTLDPHSTLLDPEEAKEMGVNLTGKFGGLGIVIRVRKDEATGAMGVVVVDLIAGDTPARRAGLAVGDRIVRINEESTENLTADEALNRLRGDPDTSVALHVRRPGTDGVRTFVVTRAVIQVPAVTSRLLGKDVGFLQIDHFSHGVAHDLRNAMRDLDAKGARGWVLDLRNNSGGLLNEAVAVADLFLDGGTIVTTVGGAERDEARATPARDDDRKPLVVLVNGATASAGEVVTGALKYLDRAVVAGTTTFGKGSVQVLFDGSEGSRLKLTVARYLTARDISLQSRGVVPDVAIEPVYVPERLASYRDVLRLEPPPGFHESDLSAHLVSASGPSEVPAVTVTYLGDPPPGEDEEPPLGPTMGFDVELARRLASSQARTRAELLQVAPKLARKLQDREDDRVAKALKGLGIDWKSGRPDPRAHVELAVDTDRPGNRVEAGEELAIRGVVTNRGTAPAYRVRARAASDDPGFDGIELVFGSVAPGATKRATVRVRTTKAAESRLVSLRFALQGQAEEATLPLSIAGRPRPQFAYAYRLVGLDGEEIASLRRGETARLRVQVRNTGPGAGEASTATLKSASGDRLVVTKGRFELPSFGAGQARDLDFAFEVKPDFDEDEAVLHLAVVDADLLEGIDRRLAVPVARENASTSAAAHATSGEVTPPSVAIIAGALTSASDHWDLTGSASDDTRVEDVFALVSNESAKVEGKKVFYAYNRDEDSRTRLDFSARIPLWPGSNRITVVARENEDVVAVRTFWVYRTAAER